MRPPAPAFMAVQNGAMSDTAPFFICVPLHPQGKSAMGSVSETLPSYEGSG
jgi:hypothetical protein